MYKWRNGFIHWKEYFAKKKKDGVEIIFFQLITLLFFLICKISVKYDLNAKNIPFLINLEKSLSIINIEVLGLAQCTSSSDNNHYIPLICGTRRVMVIVVRNGYDDSSSNPEWDCLHFSYSQGKCMCLTILSPKLCINNKAVGAL